MYVFVWPLRAKLSHKFPLFELIPRPLISLRHIEAGPSHRLVKAKCPGASGMHRNLWSPRPTLCFNSIDPNKRYVPTLLMVSFKQVPSEYQKLAYIVQKAVNIDDQICVHFRFVFVFQSGQY